MSDKSIRSIEFSRVVVGLAAILLAIALASPAQAEDLKGKWYFGGNLSFLSTTDSVRSNAQISIGSLGDDGIPFTGDPNEEQGCLPGAGRNSPFCDPRPDDLLARDAVVEETFKYDATAGFGLTSWLNFQLDVSYFKGNVGPVDAFLRDHFPVTANPVDPTALTVFRDRETVIPVQAGQLTEIPVTLSGVVRFRKDSPLNPYIGAGFGMIFANLEKSGDVDGLNGRISDMRIRGAADEFNQSITPNRFASLANEGRVPFRWPVSVDVNDAFEWHLMGGAEYFLNDRLSLVFDARYTFADQAVTMDLNGEDQVNLLIYSEKLFRADGSLAIFVKGGSAPNTLCSEVNYRGLGCDGVLRPPGQHVDPTGKDPLRDPSLPAPHSTCPAVDDFDRDGHVDSCYDPITINASPTGFKEPRGDLVVQGGKIDLTGFSIAVGMRFHW